MKFNLTLMLTSLTFVFNLVKCDGFLKSIYENMANAQEALKDVASSVNAGMLSISNTMKFLEKFVDSTLEEECEFLCKNKNDVAVPNPNHVTEVNGCGCHGLFVEEEDLPNPRMTSCCNEHDRCYDTCGSDKEICDKQFKRCLYSTCDMEKKKDIIRYRMCQGGAKLLYTATIALGCTAFRDAQSNACICKNNIFKNAKKQTHNGEL